MLNQTYSPSFSQDAHLVSYGAMSKQPLSLPTSLHIFKNLTSHGYWQTRWNSTHTQEEREKMIKFLVELMEADHVMSLLHLYTNGISYPLTCHSCENRNTKLFRSQGPMRMWVSTFVRRSRGLRPVELGRRCCSGFQDS